MVFILIGAAIASAIIAGTATFFAVRPSQGENSGATSGGAVAEIRNDVNIKEEEVNVFTAMAIVLLGIIVIIKMIELTIYSINRCKKAYKKKYENKSKTIEP